MLVFSLSEAIVEDDFLRKRAINLLLPFFSVLVVPVVAELFEALAQLERRRLVLLWWIDVSHRNHASLHGFLRLGNKLF